MPASTSACSASRRREGNQLKDAARGADSANRTEWFFTNPSVVVWGLAVLHRLASVLSIERISRLGAHVACWLGPRTRRHRRALANIARALPELSADEHRRIALGMWENFGRTVAESFVIDKIAADTGRVRLEDEAAVRGALERAGGALFVGLHFGNWEVTVIPAARLGESPIGIYKPLRNAKADAYLRGLRRELYPGGLLPANAATLLKVSRHVRAGGSMCMLADHRDNSGRVVPFFGLPAPSAALPAMLSVKYGLPIYAVRVDRAPDANFSVHVEQVRVQATGENDADAESITAAIQSIFERWIRAKPEQWVWFYNRWQAEHPARGEPAAVSV